jgi:hypothetical protein
MPMARCALLLESLVAGPAWACVLKLAGAAAALLATCDAVSGQTRIVPPYSVDAELGQSYIRLLGTSGQSAYYWSADTTPLTSNAFLLAPGLILTNAGGAYSGYAFIEGSPTQAGTFGATITAWLDSGRSYSAYFTFNVTNGGAPGLFTEPASQTNSAGAAASFAVSAYGALPLAYQWQFNGAAIPGATSNTYGITSLLPRQGGTYDVIVTNALGRIASSNATLVVGAAVTVAPFVLQSALQDQTITISFAAAVGTAYTIQASADLINWTPLTNFTASTSGILFSDSATNSIHFYRAWHP